MNFDEDRKKSKRNRWMISYSDFVTVLLAVFIMLFANANTELDKLKLLLQNQNKEVVVAAAAQVQTQQSELKKTFVELQNKDIEIIEQKESTIIRLGEKLLFDEGSAKIKPDSIKTLDKIANILTKSENQIKIEGHCDNIPIKNSRFLSNWELSSARASNIVEYLTIDKKMDKKRFTILSHADNLPVAQNSTPEGRAKNRRVDIVITN